MSAAVGVIWAQAQDRVIGHQGTMPWHLPEDLAYFKQVTSGAPVVMGRKTWESLPERFRPLPGRTNIVVTSDPERATEITAQGALTATDLDAGVALAQEQAAGVSSAVWILGGGKIYADAIDRGIAQLAAVTQINAKYDGDTYAPSLNPQQWELVAATPESGFAEAANGLGYRFETYRRIG